MSISDVPRKKEYKAVDGRDKPDTAQSSAGLSPDGMSCA